MPEACTNPICNGPIEQLGPARGSRRRFCCKACRLTFWVLKKAAKLLAPLEQVRSWEILLKLSREG
jgi:transposase-like protein